MKKKILKGFTLAEESCHFDCSAVKIGRDWNSLNQSSNKTFAKLKGFTLAEVLITLAIIGVVASLTIPTLVTNYKKKTYVTQLKKTYNYLTNGFHQIMAQDGVSNLTDTKLWGKFSSVVIPEQTVVIVQGMPPMTVPEHNATNIVPTNLLQSEFGDFKNEFMKTFNVSSIVNTNSGYNISYKLLNGDDAALVFIITQVSSSYNSGLILNDGTFLYFEFYATPQSKPSCGEHECKSLKEFQEHYNTPTKLWQKVGYIMIDVNGEKGPNVWGRDFFYFILGNDGNLYPYQGADYAIYSSNGACDYNNLSSCNNYGYWNTSLTNMNDNPIGQTCNKDSITGGIGCAARIMEEGWEMKY